MRNIFHSSRVFWSAALIATAVMLAGSVELGKVLGAGLLAHGVGSHASTATKSVPAPPEVVGGQTHVAASP